jgi:hypothetical protein
MNGVGQSLFQYLRSLSANGTSQTAQAGPESEASGATGTTSVSGGHHHHHHGNSAAMQAIQQAVTDALNSTATNSTTSGTTSSDPNQVIEQAIAKVLEGQGQAAASTDQAASTTATGTQASAQTDASARQAFFQLLQDHGIDPTQFRQDFMAAIKDAQGGQVNSATAFQSFPAGTSVDTTA